MDNLLQGLFLMGMGLLIGIIIIVIRISISCTRARKILRQAEDSEKRGDLQNAAARYKSLIFAVAANEQEVPIWLSRLEAVYRKQGRELQTDEILDAHRIIVDIRKSRMSPEEKKRLNKAALEGMKARLEAIP
jgi:hypothetical protein